MIKTVPVPPPGNVGNEPHHCHLSADKNILACGGLLSLLRGQNGIFFFDVSDARHPKFLSSTSGSQSSITDDFLPLEAGGFLVTQMGSCTTVEHPAGWLSLTKDLHMVAEWPVHPPHHGFNPHGISARPELNLMVTSDFIMPSSTLDTFPGDPELRGSIRVWDFQEREITKTIQIPDALGTMDVKLIPGDPLGRAFTAGMFDGLVYLVNTRDGTSQVVFDCEDIVPHIEVPGSRRHGPASGNAAKWRPAPFCILSSRSSRHARRQRPGTSFSNRNCQPGRGHGPPRYCTHRRRQAVGGY